MNKFLRILLWIIIIPLLLFSIFLAYSTLFEYKPEKKTLLFETSQADTLPSGEIVSAMIWNIGYTGLGANMDFFYDGGTQVRDTRENVLRNRDKIAAFISRNDSVDFILLQEVDLRSRRSYFIDQKAIFDTLLPDHFPELGMNYNVDFVPVPPKSPLGRVKSGIITYSKFLPSEVDRYAFTGNYSWPTRTFMLKRCFMVNRYPVEGGREFILINTHNSAYDDGSLRAAQLSQLADFAQDEYEKGNFVLIGGDWNQSPTGFKPAFDQPFDTLNVSYLPKDFLAGWHQVYEDSIPTNRRITAPYDRGTTLTTVIDFFVSSPNLTLYTVIPVDLYFRNSDHNPVFITFSVE